MGEKTKEIFKLKENQVIYSKHNGTPFRLVKLKHHTINKGLYHLEETTWWWIIENTKTDKRHEFGMNEIKALFNYKLS